MHTACVLLLLLWPASLHGLTCVARKSYQGDSAAYDQDSVREALDRLALLTVESTGAGSCHVTVLFDQARHKYLIEYHGNKSASQLRDQLRLHTEFHFSQTPDVSMQTQHTLTFSCSSGDLCDLRYTKRQLQWLFDIDVTQLASRLKNFVLIEGAVNNSKKMCHSANGKQACRNRPCQAVYADNVISTNCGTVDPLSSLVTKTHKVKRATDILGISPEQLMSILQLFGSGQTGGVVDASQLNSLFTIASMLSEPISNLVPDYSATSGIDVQSAIELASSILFFENPTTLTNFMQPEILNGKPLSIITQLINSFDNGNPSANQENQLPGTSLNDLTSIMNQLLSTGQLGQTDSNLAAGPELILQGQNHLATLQQMASSSKPASQTIKSAVATIAVDTSISDIDSLKNPNVMAAKLKHPHHRTINLRCALDLCNDPNNFTNLTAAIQSNYELPGMLQSLSKQNDDPIGKSAAASMYNTFGVSVASVLLICNLLNRQ